MTTAMQVGETARNRANFRRCFKTDTAIFLHDDGMVAHLTSVRSLARLVHRTDTAYPCADNFKVRIEGDKVRAVSGRDPSKLGLKAQKCGGGPRGHDEGVDKGDSEQRTSVAHRLDHGEVSARERAVGASQAIFVQRDLPSLQHELPV